LPKDERITIPGVETKPSGELRSDEQQSLAGSNSRTGNRSNYDNVASVQQHRTVSNLLKTTGGRGYEEANV